RQGVALALVCAARWAHPPPVGGLVATAGEAAHLDEGLQQIEGMAIFALPVAADTPGDAAQQMAGQMRYPHPGGDQKASVVGNQMQALTPGRPVPADVRIAVGA